MAASHGVADPAGPARVDIDGVGPFGRSVADRLRVLFDREPAHLAVVAVWRPDHDLVVARQRDAFACGSRFLPIVHDARTVRVGPLVRPADPPCAACLARRIGQHASHGEAAELRARMAADPEFGIGGFLPHVASAAAALALRLVRQDDRCPTRPRQATVLTLRTDRMSVAADLLLAAPGCPECAAAGPVELHAVAEVAR